MYTISQSPRYTDQELLQVFLRNDLYAFVQKVFENYGDRYAKDCKAAN